MANWLKEIELDVVSLLEEPTAATWYADRPARLPIFGETGFSARTLSR